MEQSSLFETISNEPLASRMRPLSLDEFVGQNHLTGDSYVTSLTNEDSSNSNINLNGYKLYVGGHEFKK